MTTWSLPVALSSGTEEEDVTQPQAFALAEIGHVLCSPLVRNRVLHGLSGKSYTTSVVAISGCFTVSPPLQSSTGLFSLSVQQI